MFPSDTNQSGWESIRSPEDQSDKQNRAVQMLTLGPEMAGHVKCLRAQVWSPTSIKRLGMRNYSCNASTGNAEAEGLWGSLSSQPIKAMNSRLVRKPVSENKVCCSWGMTSSLTSAFHIATTNMLTHVCTHTHACTYIHRKCWYWLEAPCPALIVSSNYMINVNIRFCL